MVLNYNLFIIRSLAMLASSCVIYKTSGIVEKYDYLNVKKSLVLPFVTLLCPFPCILGCFSFTGMNVHGKCLGYFLVRIHCRETAAVINFSLDLIF